MHQRVFSVIGKKSTEDGIGFIPTLWNDANSTLMK